MFQVTDKIVSAVVTLGCIGVCLFLWVQKDAPPVELLAITTLLIGRYAPKPGATGKK